MCTHTNDLSSRIGGWSDVVEPQGIQDVFDDMLGRYKSWLCMGHDDTWQDFYLILTNWYYTNSFYSYAKNLIAYNL
jgi:hypothetical protein